jgi:hypothetical protein
MMAIRKVGAASSPRKSMESSVIVEDLTLIIDRSIV